jgi:electron transfer flavoprotein beta subunit
VTGIKAIEIAQGRATVRRQTESGWETAEVSLPAVLTVKEGLNLPRYPSLPGRLKAKKKEIERITPHWQDGGLHKIRLKLPVQAEHTVEILGKNGDAGAQLVEVFQRLRLL